MALNIVYHRYQEETFIRDAIQSKALVAPWRFQIYIRESDAGTRYAAPSDLTFSYTAVLEISFLPWFLAGVHILLCISPRRAHIYMYMYNMYIHIYMCPSWLTRLFSGSAENRLSTSKLSPHITAIEVVDRISRTSTRRSPGPFHRNLSWLLSSTSSSSSSSPGFFLSSLSLSHLSLPFRIYIGVVERLRPQVRLYITKHVPARDMLHAVRPDLERRAKDAEGERRLVDVLQLWEGREKEKEYVCICVGIDLP